MDTNSIYQSQGHEPYKNLLVFTKDNTETVSKDNKLSLFKIYDVANHIINDFKRSPVLMDAAVNFYDPNDIFISHVVNNTIFSLKMALDMNLSEEDIQDTVAAALIHDVGLMKIAEIILEHHERADGSGYPNGLKESEQQLPARIISIVDVYEALIHPRIFRDALVPPKGLEVIIMQTSRFTCTQNVRERTLGVSQPNT